MLPKRSSQTRWLSLLVDAFQQLVRAHLAPDLQLLLQDLKHLLPVPQLHGVLQLAQVDRLLSKVKRGLKIKVGLYARGVEQAGRGRGRLVLGSLIVSTLSPDGPAVVQSLQPWVRQALRAWSLLLLRQVRPHLLDFQALLRLVESPDNYALCRQLLLFWCIYLHRPRQPSALCFVHADGL